jgi:hypothetical protein
MWRRQFPILIITLCALAQASPMPARAWALAGDGFERVPVPAGAESIAMPTSADLNADGTPETLSLAEGRLSIRSDGAVAWQSPEGWDVLQAGITELDSDGIPEATMLLWRPFKPWPVDRFLAHGGRIASFHDKEGNSCHIILIGWRRGVYREVWAGSAMADPVTAFAAVDLNGDGRQELVTLEGRYADHGRRAVAVKAWEWNGFGFTVLAGREGTFSGISIVKEEQGRTLMLTH